MEGIEQAGMVDGIKSTFDIDLQETRYGPIAPGYIHSINDQFNGQVSRTFRAVTYLRFREESLGLCRGGNTLADHRLEVLS
jgi:hypothetical protein